MEYISTSALASELGIKSNDLFDKLKGLNWIDKQNDKWVLTEQGKQKGGQMRTSQKFGDYVVWPKNIKIDTSQSKGSIKNLNATAIGKHFNISSQRLNLVLSELGWIEKDIAGWQITKLGKGLGGRQLENDTSGGTYVMWPENILSNENLSSIFKEASLVSISKQQVDKNIQVPTSSNSFRDKFPATLRTRDGHIVRSRAEVIIDNALYEYKLAHAYERKLPIEEELYSDFYLPIEGGVYIEFWGMEDDPKYSERKKIKTEIYNKYEFKLIELNDTDISNLDDHLPKKLLKFGIKVY